MSQQSLYDHCFRIAKTGLVSLSLLGILMPLNTPKAQAEGLPDLLNNVDLGQYQDVIDKVTKTNKNPENTTEGEETPPDVVIDDEPSSGEPSTTTNPSPSASTTPRFTCEVNNGQYTVMYHPESQPEKTFPWAVPSEMGGGWSPENRCTEISKRLESYRPDGLVELQTAIEGNYNIICVTTEANPTCRIVLTVPPGKNPEVTRDLVFQNLTVADSGQSTEGVSTFVGGSQEGNILEQIGGALPGIGKPNSNSRSGNGIYLKPFLDQADGGTGRGLSNLNSKPSSSDSRLNPGNFR